MNTPNDREAVLAAARQIADVSKDKNGRESFEFDDHGLIAFAAALASDTGERGVVDMAAMIVRDVAELPDRNSPEDAPDMMLVSADELREIVLRHAALRAQPAGGGCDWQQQDRGGDWVSTACGNEFVLNDASQYKDGEQVFPHCPYCAKPATFHNWEASK